MAQWEDEPRKRSARTLGSEQDGRREHDVVATRRRAATFGDYRSDRRATQGLRGFVRRYGWRAYALPALAVITVLALLSAGNAPSHKDVAHGTPPAQTVQPGHSAQPTAPPAAASTSVKSDQPSAGSHNNALKAGQLPAGAPYTVSGTGTFRVLKGSSAVVGKGKLFRYSVEVENGITGIDLKQYADLVQSVLVDRRSWAGHGDVALQRVDSTQADFHVSLVSSMTVRRLCGYDIPVETSCYAATDPVTGATINRVVINDARWVRGDAAYLGDVTAYRIYMINHEDGHAIGHEHAHQCLPGGLAPVMMQQTIGLKSATTGQLCQANPWPYPPGATGAPGAEQPDTPQNSEFGLNDGG